MCIHNCDKTFYYPIKLIIYNLFTLFCNVYEFIPIHFEKKGRRSHDEDLKDMIPKLASFMETCLDQWLLHFKDKRKSYLHLNYFTVDQLVILQRELVKMGTQEEPSHLIYPLLSAVKENCTPGETSILFL